MNFDPTEAHWLHQHIEFSFEQVCDLSGLSADLLRQLADEGVLVPVNPAVAHWTFTADRLVVARRASRLSRDFDLAPNALALALTLLERINGLETELQDLRARLPHRHG